MKRRFVLACGALAVLVAGVACGDGDTAGADDDADSPATTAANNGTDEPVAHDRDPSPELEAPASQYAILQPDLTDDYLTMIERTFVLDAGSYARGAAAVFGSAEEGEAMLNGWGYIDGYETQYEPEGRATSVLAGRYYAGVETHLFETEDGAREAYTFFAQKLEDASERGDEPQIGNEASSWTYHPGNTIGNTTVEQVYHRVVFRRGNLVAVVSTLGARPLVDIDAAIHLAAIIDEKALGERDLVEPTPTNQQGNGE